MKDNQGFSLECVKNHIIEDPNVAIMAIDNKCRLVLPTILTCGLPVFIDKT